MDKKTANKKWYESHKTYYAEKIECEFCHKKIKRSHMSRHHATTKCKKQKTYATDLVPLLLRLKEITYDITDVLNKELPFKISLFPRQ